MWLRSHPDATVDTSTRGAYPTPIEAFSAEQQRLGTLHRRPNEVLTSDQQSDCRIYGTTIGPYDLASRHPDEVWQASLDDFQLSRRRKWPALTKGMEKSGVEDATVRAGGCSGSLLRRGTLPRGLRRSRSRRREQDEAAPVRITGGHASLIRVASSMTRAASQSLPRRARGADPQARAARLGDDADQPRQRACGAGGAGGRDGAAGGGGRRLEQVS